MFLPISQDATGSNPSGGGKVKVSIPPEPKLSFTASSLSRKLLTDTAGMRPRGSSVDIPAQAHPMPSKKKK